MMVPLYASCQVMLPALANLWSLSWLTDRTPPLYPSSYFCVLKSKPLLSFLSLFGGGDGGFRIGLAAQIDARNQCVAAIQSIVHPLPANLHRLRIPLCSIAPEFLNLLKRGHENAS